MSNVQGDFIRKYNDEHRIPFNDELFIRDDDEIVSEVMKVIMSIQRKNDTFTLLVDSFTITEDYDKINQILGEWKNRTQQRKKKKDINEYEYVNLKETACKLLTVHYFIQVKEESRMMDVHILIPKIVNKYYFKIGGNMWLAMLQIVDGSTYNNSLVANPKNQSISFKIISTPVRMFKNIQEFTDVNDEVFYCNFYTSNIMKKTLPMFKYILAKYGFVGTQEFTQIDCIFFSEEPITDKKVYCLKLKENLYLNCPRFIFDKDNVVQSLFYTIWQGISKFKKVDLKRAMSNEFWLEVLGDEFKTPTSKKGLDLLTSLEGIYDITTKEDLRLNDYSKRNIYSILLWIIREFPRLRQKDNLDVSLKKIRYGQHIAALYSMKLIRGIKIITSSKNKITVEKIMKSIRTKPKFLLDCVCKSNLVNYRNLVNDLDSILALKYSFKGISGIGNENNQSIPDIYRHVHPSHMGILDVDSSPKSDPGISGVLCPMVKLYDGYFSEYQETDLWEEEFEQTMKDYRDMVNHKELLHYKKRVGMRVDDTELTIIEENLKVAERMISPLKYQHKDKRLDRFKNITDLGGRIYFE